MPNKNRIEIEGHLAKDAEVKETSGGKEIVKFSVATSRYDKSKSKEEQVTDWHNVTVFGYATSQARYLKKGDAVRVEGEVNYDKFKGSDGIEKTYTSIKSFSVHKIEWFKKQNGNDIYKEENIPEDSFENKDDSDLPF